MVIDSSALIAILFGEPEALALAQAIDRDPVRLISAVSIFESSIVALARLGQDGCDELDLLLARTNAEVRAFEPADLPLVRTAYRDFGKGRHPAALNFGDCFSYALASVTGEPILFKGEDFSKTDLRLVEF
ncbi:MAG: type II toxin-antitoxin system VapC family toxin [Candidatus Eremiobacteraeota bacterium]|nr:type II toxin-antitoxin system VapC family toxin [Candidatus Eremiobacteraeota bacterium]